MMSFCLKRIAFYKSWGLTGPFARDCPVQQALQGAIAVHDGRG